MRRVKEWTAGLTLEQQLQQALAEADRLLRRRRLFNNYDRIYDPACPDLPGVYSWQEEFHNAGATYSTRCIIAGNQCGKTRSGAAEIAMHLTGDYPNWWKGKRFTHGVKIWCGSTTNEKSRDIIQEALLGPLGDWGTGWVPASRLIGKPKVRQAGVPDVIDTFLVYHVSGEASKCQLKTYEQGRESWQGTAQDVIWFDEEPPQDIWSEGITRTVATNGIMILTFTPLLGISEVVFNLLHPREGANIYVKNVTWDDAPHLDEKKKSELKASYSEFEIDARTKGVPLMARGLIFPISDSSILCEPFRLPDWYARINGIDFGMDHPTAGAFLAHDSEKDIIYVYDEYHMQGQTPIYHSVAMKRNGEWIPTAWPRDGLQRDKGSGQQLKDMYRGHGLYMLKENAHYKDERGEHVEPGLLEMLEYMKTGKFKVFRTCQKFMEEKRFYHRDDKGQIVKIRDDVISAARYAFMMRRYAQPKPSHGLARNAAPSVPIIGRR